MRVYHKNIPTYNVQENKWSKTSFDTQQEFGNYLMTFCFKEPGEYNFPDSVALWQKPMLTWKKDKAYTQHVKNTKDYYAFWDDELLKCRLGVIWIDGDQQFYLTRDYYFLLNYCPILNKEKGQEEDFMSSRDVQYHLLLYIKLAEILNKHAVILKRRQMAYSVCLVAKSLNYLLFENKKTIKWVAVDLLYLNEVNGSWKILAGMMSHIFKHTAWKKVFNPSVYPQIQQLSKIKTSSGWVTRGNQSTLAAISIGKDVKAVVGGACYMLWNEEGGISPEADDLLTYMEPALKSGNETVGIFILGGSVGDLDQCKPLQKMMRSPEVYDMLPTKSRWVSKSGVEKVVGLFIPAQYGMPQAVDKNGNSLVEEALRLLDEEEEKQKKKSERDYITYKSQNPRYLDDAFATKKHSNFPLKAIEARQDYITSNNIKGRPVKLTKDGNTINWKYTEGEDVPYPVDMKEDNRGVVLMYEPPLPEARSKRLYLAGVDTIETGTTESSDSLFSVYILKAPIKILKPNKDGKNVIHYEGGKIVASYTGRFPDVEDTFKVAEYLLRLYNAFTLVERNRPGFINHMKREGLSHLLARESDIPLFRDLQQNENKNDNYGVYMAGNGNNHKLRDGTLIRWLNTPIDYIYKEGHEGDMDQVVKTVRRVDSIDDIWLLEEFRYEDDNTDRRDALGLATWLYEIYENEHIVVSVSSKSKSPSKITQEIKPVSFINKVNSVIQRNTVNFINKR